MSTSLVFDTLANAPVSIRNYPTPVYTEPAEQLSEESRCLYTLVHSGSIQSVAKGGKNTKVLCGGMGVTECVYSNAAETRKYMNSEPLEAKGLGKLR